MFTRITHGHTVGFKSSITYKSWSNMIQRCTNKNHTKFGSYGGKGIGVCNRWKVFSDFLSDMGARPSEEYCIDRIDPDIGYSPGNCRWITISDNARRIRTAIMITYLGQTKTLGDWCRELELKKGTIYDRIYKRGWSVNKAFTQPIGNAGGWNNGSR